MLGNIPGDPRARRRARRRAYHRDAGLQLNFGGAYNDAIYTDWSTATCPRSVAGVTVTVCDNTGKQIVGAPKWTAIIGFDYEFALAGGFMGRAVRQPHVPLGAQPRAAAVAVRRAGRLHAHRRRRRVHRATRAALTYEVSLVAKNVFDTQYTTSVNDFSNNAPVGYDGIGPRRYVGVDLRVLSERAARHESNR